MLPMKTHLPSDPKRGRPLKASGLGRVVRSQMEEKAWARVHRVFQWLSLQGNTRHTSPGERERERRRLSCEHLPHSESLMPHYNSATCLIYIGGMVFSQLLLYRKISLWLYFPIKRKNTGS